MSHYGYIDQLDRKIARSRVTKPPGGGCSDIFNTGQYFSDENSYPKNVVHVNDHKDSEKSKIRTIVNGKEITSNGVEKNDTGDDQNANRSAETFSKKTESTVEIELVSTMENLVVKNGNTEVQESDSQKCLVSEHHIDHENNEKGDVERNGSKKESSELSENKHQEISDTVRPKDVIKDEVVVTKRNRIPPGGYSAGLW